ncbi:uncharacterized protein Hap1MRO34_003079 [Clarias gariepinus]
MAGMVVIVMALNASLSIFIQYNLLIIVKERYPLTCVTAFLYILTMITLFASLNFISESDSRNTETWRSVSCVVVYMVGTVLVVFVNAAVLFGKIILKAMGYTEYTVDLRLILLPTESVFAVYCLGLLLYDSCKKRQLSDSPLHSHELQTLALEPQPSGS